MNNTLRTALDNLRRMCKEKGQALYVVGGTVRDWIMNQSYEDLDFTGTHAPEMGEKFALENKFTLVRLDKTPGRETYRVVVNKIFNLDFTRMRGQNIEQDLAQRDFTINAMAVPLEDFPNAPKPLDPHGGLRDIRDRVVRVLSGTAFEDDPLRLLRAFRFARCLEFTIEPQTLKEISRHKDGLKWVAGERILHELMILLKTSRSQLDTLDRVGLWQVLIPEIESLRIPNKEGRHAWKESLDTVAALEIIMENPGQVFPEHGTFCSEFLKHDRVRALLKLAALLHRLEPEVTNHPNSFQRKKSSIAFRILKRLRLSNTDIQITSRVLGFLRPVSGLAGALTRNDATESEIYRLVRDSHPELPGICLLSAAADSVLKPPSGKFRAALNRILDFYINKFIPAQTRPSLLNGDILTTRLHLFPSPLFKVVLETVEEARVLGTITTQEEAISLAGTLIQRLKQEKV